MGRHCARLSQLAFFGIVCSYILNTAAFADDAQLLTQLNAKWAEQFALIRTAELDVDFFRCINGSHQEISREGVRTLLEKMSDALEGGASLESIREMTRDIVLPKRFANTWVSGRILQQGEMLRNHFKANLIAGAFPDEIDNAYDGNVDVQYVRDSEQVSLFETKSMWLKYDANFLRRLGTKDFTTIHGPVENGIVTLRNDKGDSIRAMVDSAGVLEISQSNGRTASDFLQWGLAEYDGGENATVIFPSMSASVEYVDGKVTNLFLFLVRNAKFNHTLPEDAFSVPVPAQTRAALFEGPKQVARKGVVVLKNPTTDAKTALPIIHDLLKKREATSPALATVRKSSVRGKIIVMNTVGILLLGVGFWMFRKKPARLDN